MKDYPNANWSEDTRNDPVPTGQKTLKDALILAANDAEFRSKLASNPEQLQAEYNLTDAQIAELQSLQQLVGAVDDPNLVVANYEDGGGGNGTGGNGGGNSSG